MLGPKLRPLTSCTDDKTKVRLGGGKRPNTKQSVLSWKGTILGYPCMHATSPSPKGKTTFLCFKNIYGPPTSLLKSQNVHFMYICNIKVSSGLRAPTNINFTIRFGFKYLLLRYCFSSNTEQSLCDNLYLVFIMTYERLSSLGRHSQNLFST